jgi:hypothetical protein
MGPARPVIAGDTVFRRAVNDERDASADRLLLIRVVGVSCWFCFQTLAALGITVEDSPDSRAIAPILGVYVAIAIGHLLAARARPVFRKLVWISLPLVDLPMFFLVNYRVIETTEFPLFNVASTMSAWLILLMFAQFSLRRGTILAIGGFSIVFQILIYVRGGTPYMWPMAVVTIGIAAAASVLFATRNLALLRRVTDESTRRVKEMRVLADELRRQVADRSRELAAALSRLEALPQPGVPAPGELVDGRYEVVSLLGTGAMGSVYEARRIADDRAFAVKVIRGVVTTQALARFAREAELAAQLHHPNVVEVHDVGIEANGRFFLVMELVEGASLAKSRARFGDVARALPILAQIADGLVAIHGKGVVHRDLKPSNVLVSSTGMAKIADFGVAGLTPRQIATLTDDGQALTRTGVVLGTPDYMAPELVDGARDAAPSADVFSFGVLAYELLTSRPAFATAPARVRLAGGLPAQPEPLQAPDLDRAIAKCIDRCLDLDPKKRPPAHELAARLRAHG